MQQTHLDATSTPQLTTSSSSSSVDASVHDRATVLLVVLLGLPGAGKSTLAAAMCRAAEQHGGELGTGGWEGSCSSLEGYMVCFLNISGESQWGSQGFEL
jgi:ABC-type transport system involved in cytochrome bd biosynthesis fused ATPase/permease subunit